MYSSSSTWSKLAVSLTPSAHTGNSRSRSPGRWGECSSASRVRIQLRLPCTVLISPLWEMKR